MSKLGQNIFEELDQNSIRPFTGGKENQLKTKIQVEMEIEDRNDDSMGDTSLAENNSDLTRGKLQGFQRKKAICNELNPAEKEHFQRLDLNRYHGQLFSEVQLTLKSNQSQVQSEQYMKDSISYHPLEYLSFNMEIENKTLMNKIRPTVHFYLPKKQINPLLSARKISNPLTSTIIVSKSKEDFSENSQNYVGKIKGNFKGTIFNIFGPGYSPKVAKKQSKDIRSILATVEVLESKSHNCDLNYRVYLLHPLLKYYDLNNTKDDEQEIPLNELYKKNSDKIMILNARKPQWRENLRRCEGKGAKGSLKNFVLEEGSNPRMIFSKNKRNGYNADLWNPLSPFIGFGVALVISNLK